MRDLEKTRRACHGVYPAVSFSVAGVIRSCSICEVSYFVVRAVVVEMPNDRSGRTQSDERLGHKSVNLLPASAPLAWWRAQISITVKVPGDVFPHAPAR